MQTSLELLVLQRASQLLVAGVFVQDGVARGTFVLHGPVVRDLLRQNCRAKRELVNLAASLSALQVVKIKVCRTWMGGNGATEEDLQPFVEAIDLFSGEVEYLRRERRYLDF